jgi:hypothetical protein
LPKLVIGVWTFDSGDLFGTLNGISSCKSIDERLKGLEQAAKHVQKRVQEKSGSPSFDSILAAPEYLFSDRNADGDRAPMPELERLKLEQRLLGLSREYPRMLMFPGTLFYCKDLIRPTGAEFKFNPNTGVRDLQKTTSEDRRERYRGKLNQVLQETKDLFQNPEERVQVVRQGAVRGDKKPTQSPAISSIALALRLKNPRIARNAAYVLLNGQRIAKYDKRADFAETRGATADDLAFIPGTIKQCPQVDGYRLGVEICYDHQLGALVRRGIIDLRFHLLLSDPSETDESAMAMMKGGFFIHACTIGSWAGVWARNTNGTIQKLTGEDVGPIVSCEEMYLYEVTLA